MRRLLALIAAAALMIPAVAVIGVEPYEYYKDKFDGVSFSGSNGSLQWKGPWVEFGDEYEGPSEGSVRVAPEGCSGGKCLHLEGELLEVEDYGVYRSADLSMFETVELCFELRIDGISEAVLSVYVSAEGSSWERVRSYPVLTSQGYHHPIVDLDDFRTEGFAVKFEVEGLVGGEVITIDNVELKGTVAGTASTSTSTSSTSSTSPTSTSTSTSTTSAAPSTTSAVERTTSTSSPTTTSSTATTRPQPAAAVSSSTTTTTAATTTTTSSGTGAGLPPQPPFDSGLRDTPGGLIADYEQGMMGEMDMAEVEVLGAEITADFSMAVEVFESAKVWVAVLVLFVTAAIVSGMDWRRTRRSPTPRSMS